MRIRAFFCLLILSAAFVCNAQVLCTASLPERLELPYEAGEEEFVSSGDDRELRFFPGYALCYRESYEQAEWVAYTLTPEKLIKNTKRTGEFREDPEISTGSALPEDYRFSGYDRGHLAPAADFAYSLETMTDSFFMSNMSPQTPAFNRGGWAKLEAFVRTLAAKAETLYIVTGPVLEKKAGEYGSIGENCVSVPEFYYKALLLVVPAGDAASGGSEAGGNAGECGADEIPEETEVVEAGGESGAGRIGELREETEVAGETGAADESTATEESGVAEAGGESGVAGVIGEVVASEAAGESGAAVVDEASACGSGKLLYAMGFILPNEKIDWEPEAFLCSIDEIEQRTGIDFFCRLDDEIENLLESESCIPFMQN